MDILNNAKRHFTQEVAGKVDFVEVPEWGEGGEAAKIHYRPMNLAQESAIMSAVQNGSITDGYVETLMVRALKDDEKTRVFPESSRNIVRRQLDPAVVKRVVNEMGGIDDLMIPEDDTEKNS